jgi:hypothetical protein
MVAADLVRGLVLTPIAILGLTGHLSIWAIAPAGFVVACASSYFFPAFNASLPALVGRDEVQRANGLVAATNSTVMVAGRTVAAALLAVVSIGSFFAVNAISFFVSAALLLRVRIPETAGRAEAPRLSIREGFAALRVRPGLRVAIAMLALGTAVMTGVWTVGVAELAHGELDHGAAGLALLLAATAFGTISAGAFIVRRPSATRCGRAARPGCCCSPATSCSRRGRCRSLSRAPSSSGWRPGQRSSSSRRPRRPRSPTRCSGA